MAVLKDLIVNGAARILGVTHTDVDGHANTYFVKGTQTAATGTWTGDLPNGVTSYFDGLSIDYYLPYSGSGSATLNLGGLGDKPVYLGNDSTGRVTTHFPATSVIHLTYLTTLNSGSGGWRTSAYYYSDTDTTYQYESIYCVTAASTAAKIGNASEFTNPQSTNAASYYFQIFMKYSNTYAGPITLNINSTGAKTIYINGKISSSSNYTLPAGYYLVYTDGSYYHFSTTGDIPMNPVSQEVILSEFTSVGFNPGSSAATLLHTGTGTPSFQFGGTGSSEVIRGYYEDSGSTVYYGTTLPGKTYASTGDVFFLLDS